MGRVPSTRCKLRQIQVIHRHGDRTPLHNVFKGAANNEEALEVKRWKARLPDACALDTLKQTYRIQYGVDSPQHAANDRPGAILPPQHKPFGCLTATGIEQMRQRGNHLRQMCIERGFPLDHLSAHDIHVFSNSYERTQYSVQALLSGLLRDQLRLTPTIRVLPPAVDMINTYAAFPQISDLKATLEAANQEFQAREQQMADRKIDLQRRLPLFSAGVPFTWMTSADYFTCRNEHGISFIQGTEEHHEHTLRHLSFRFRQFYTQQPILRLVAGRMMRNVLHEMQRSIAGADDAKQVVIYSGHDVSVLSVLHAIGATIVHDEEWWPSYASAIVLELLEDTDQGQWFIRASLDGQDLQLQHKTGALHPHNAFHQQVLEILGEPALLSLNQ